MADHPPSHGDKDRNIADPTWFFREDKARGLPGEGPGRPTPAAGDDYALEEGFSVADRRYAPLPEDPPARAPRPSSTERPARGADRDFEADRRGRTAEDDAASVGQVWSRGAEWGRNLLVLAGIVLATAWAVYLAISAGSVSLTVASMAAGGAAFLLCSYPILISLERPVRITPEQAVRDYYSSLSHHAPHFRRMWLLLSDSGRESASFSNFAEFKTYWSRLMAGLREGRARRFTPLRFDVVDFKAEKSVGKTAIDAKYIVEVYVRGRESRGPAGTYRVQATLVRGRDRMWYLNQGDLPAPRA